MLASSWKVNVVLVGLLWLTSVALCALPNVPPHSEMHYIFDARLLWNTVTNSKVFPGLQHTLNYDYGVTERWKELLREHGNDALDVAVHDLKVLTASFDRRDYKAESRFRRFLRPQERSMFLPVSEPGEQFVARRMVNAFTDYWYQHYAAERELQQQALEQQGAGAAREGESSSDTGPGQVVQAEQGSAKRRRPSGVDSPPRERIDQSW